MDTKKVQMTSDVNQKIDGAAARKYWANVASDTNAMLGSIPSFKGFTSVPRIDIQGSRTFLARLGIGTKRDRRTISSALDAGAGCVTFSFSFHISRHFCQIRGFSPARRVFLNKKVLTFRL